MEALFSFSTKERGVVKVLLENKPKWIALLLYLKKKGVMSLREVRQEVKMSYTSLKRAIMYLGGIELGRGKTPMFQSPITPLGIEPLISVIMVSHYKKYITLTDRGEQFAENLAVFLKSLITRYGYVDVERKYGVSMVYVYEELAKKLRNVPENIESRLVSYDELLYNLSTRDPRLIDVLRPEIVKPELLDMVPIEISIAGRRKIILYLVS